MSELAWQALLTALKQAGLEYENIHRVVTAFFVARDCGSDSEGLADVTLDRVGQKIHEGENVQSIVAYSKGCAYLVWHEYVRDRIKFREAMKEFARQAASMYEVEEKTNLRHECQEACLKRLGESEHKLMVDYYLMAEDREALAASLGIVIATLRTKIHRQKQRLEKCVEDCLRSA